MAIKMGFRVSLEYLSATLLREAQIINLSIKAKFDKLYFIKINISYNYGYCCTQVYHFIIFYWVFSVTGASILFLILSLD